MLNQRQNLATLISVDHNCNLYINVQEITITVFQRQNNIILPTLTQLQNLKLKERWFWVDTKTNFVVLYQPPLFGIISFQYTFLFQSSFVPPWNIVCDYTVFKNSYTSLYLFWSNLSAIRVVFSWYFMKCFRKWRLLTVLERDSSTGISLWILWNF